MDILLGAGYLAVSALNARLALVLLALARRSSVVMWRGRHVKEATLRASSLLCAAVIFGAIGVHRFLSNPFNIIAVLFTGILVFAGTAALVTFEVIRHRRLREGGNVGA
jgi:predicted membrane protein